MPVRAITNKTIEAIRELARAGWEYKEIASKLGISVASVNKYRSERQTREEVARQKARVRTPEQIERGRERARAYARKLRDGKKRRIGEDNSRGMDGETRQDVEGAV